MFEIPVGGPRYRALDLLVEQKRLAKTAPVPCVVRDPSVEVSAEEDSLAENLQRAALHPLDQFRAFKTLRDQGAGDEEIAARFFVPLVRLPFDQAPERAGRNDALAVGRQQLDRQAGNAAQLEHHALHHHAKALPQGLRIGGAQLQGSRDAVILQPHGQAAGNAPQVGEVDTGQGVILRRRIKQQLHAIGMRLLLGGAVGNLGQQLGRRDAHGNRNADPLADGAAQLAGMPLQPVLEACRAQERLAVSLRCCRR